MVYSIYCVMILTGKPQLHVGTSRYLFILTCEIRTYTSLQHFLLEDKLRCHLAGPVTLVLINFANFLLTDISDTWNGCVFSIGTSSVSVGRVLKSFVGSKISY